MLVYPYAACSVWLTATAAAVELPAPIAAVLVDAAAAMAPWALFLLPVVVALPRPVVAYLAAAAAAAAFAAAAVAVAAVATEGALCPLAQQLAALQQAEGLEQLAGQHHPAAVLGGQWELWLAHEESALRSHSLHWVLGEHPSLVWLLPSRQAPTGPLETRPTYSASPVELILSRCSALRRRQLLRYLLDHRLFACWMPVLLWVLHWMTSSPRQQMASQEQQPEFLPASQ